VSGFIYCSKPLGGYVASLPIGSGNGLASLTDAMTFASGLTSAAKNFNPSNDLLPGV
jgi:hypothetical protein